MVIEVDENCRNCPGAVGGSLSAAPPSTGREMRGPRRGRTMPEGMKHL